MVLDMSALSELYHSLLPASAAMFTTVLESEVYLVCCGALHEISPGYLKAPSPPAVAHSARLAIDCQ